MKLETLRFLGVTLGRQLPIVKALSHSNHIRSSLQEADHLHTALRANAAHLQASGTPNCFYCIYNFFAFFFLPLTFPSFAVGTFGFFGFFLENSTGIAFKGGVKVLGVLR